jgi:hypothetical protein
LAPLGKASFGARGMDCRLASNRDPSFNDNQGVKPQDKFYRSIIF